MDTQMPLAAAGGGEAVAGAFNAAGGLAQEGKQLFQDEYERNNKVSVDDALIKMGLLKNQIQANAYQVRGKDTLGLAKQSQEDFAKGVRDIMGTLQNRDQQTMFYQHVPTNATHLDHAIQLHSAQQMERYQDETEMRGVQEKQDSAKLNWQTWNLPEEQNAVDYAAMGAAHHVDMLYQGKGADPKVVAWEQKQAVSSTYAGVVETMLANKQDGMASQAFQKWKQAGYFTGKDEEYLASRVGNQNRLGEAYRLSDTIMSYQPETVEAGLKHLDQLSDQDNIDPQVRKEAESLIRERWHSQNLAKEADEAKLFNGILDQMRKGADPRSLRQSPDFENLDERDKERFDLIVGRMAKKESPYAAFDNPAVLNNLTLMSDQDLQAVGKMDPDRFNAFMNRLVPQVTEPTYKAFLAKVRGEDRKAEKPVSFSLNEREKEDLFSKLHLAGALDKSASAKNLTDLKRKTEDAQSEFTGHVSEFERRIQDEFVTPEHRLPTGEEFRKMRDQYLIEQIKKAKTPWSTMILRWGIYAPAMDREIGETEQQERMKRAGIIMDSPSRFATDRNVTPTGEKKK
jgi:hypothetical protein